MYHNWHSRTTVEDAYVRLVGSGTITDGQLDLYAQKTSSQENILLQVIKGVNEANGDAKKLQELHERLDNLPSAQILDLMIRMERDYKDLFFQYNNKNSQKSSD